MFLVQLSSAADECVFSMLNGSFGDQQRNSLENYVEATITLQYKDHYNKLIVQLEY